MPSAGIFSTLADHLAETRRLLRDSTGSLYTDPDLVAFVNRALRRRDMDLGINRVRILVTLTPSVYDYSFTTLAAGTLLDGPTNAVLQDVRSIHVLPLGSSPSSAIRYPLGRWPYTQLAFLLSTSYPTYPARYAMYGPDHVMLGPPPAGAYPAEFDFVAYSANLVQSTDVDPMPYPYSDPVPFGAAYLAKIQSQRFDEADGFLASYDKHLNNVRARSRSQAVTNPWDDLPRR